MAPISPGRNGGPLVNADGELVGIMTFRYDKGPADNLHYAISATHLKKLMATAGTTVRPFSAPSAAPPLVMQPVAPNPAKGNVKKTLAVWKELNKALIELTKKTEACEEELKKIPPANPQRPSAVQTTRAKKKSRVYEEMADAYKEYAGKVTAIETRDADPQVVNLAAAASEIAGRAADLFHKIAMSIAVAAELDQADTPASIAVAAEFDQADTLAKKLSGFKGVNTTILNQCDFLRLVLCRKYETPFPTLEEITRQSDKAIAGQDFRTWTSSNGKSHVKAKLIRVKDGFVKLETAASKKITVPIERLSDVDQ